MSQCPYLFHAPWKMAVPTTLSPLNLIALKLIAPPLFVAVVAVVVSDLFSVIAPVQPSKRTRARGGVTPLGD